MTEMNLEWLRADVASSAPGPSIARAASTRDSAEVARMLTKMAASAGRVFVVADGSKLGKTALWHHRPGSRLGRLDHRCRGGSLAGDVAEKGQHTGFQSKAILLKT